MSEPLKFPNDETPDIDGDEEYEEISSEDVDRIVAALDDLMESTDSLNIRMYLEEAAANIYGLVYDEDDLEEAA
jgi:hypothetical protein